MSDPVKGIANRIKRRCEALAPIMLRHERSDPWQSVLFDGGRHRIELSLRGTRVAEALEALQAEIAMGDFAIPGHLVAEIHVAAVNCDKDEALVTLDALTIKS